jgi:hypothetical protein
VAPLPELEAEIEGLYRLTLAAFTSGRDALAARCRSAGDREGAARVKKLAKPSASAWAVNQLHWTEQVALERFFLASRQVREAQRTGQPASAARAAMQGRRDAMARLVRRAEAILEDAGHGTAPLVLRRIAATLEAVAHRVATGEAVTMGRLAEDLEAPGLDALAAFAEPSLSATPATVLSFPAAASAKEAALAPLEVEAARTARRAAEAEAEAAVARERLTAARAELEEARRRVTRAEERVRDAEASSNDASARASAAAHEEQAAERALVAARDVGAGP